MSEQRVGRHGLEPFLASLPEPESADQGVRLDVHGDLGHINVRGKATDSGFVAAVEDVLGQPLPATPNTMSSDEHRVMWLGPDEWLIVTTAQGVAGLAARLSDATSKYHAAVSDISGGQVALMIEGTKTRDILAKGCTLDLHASVFTAGSCAQSGLAKATVLLACLDDTPTFMIVVRRSFSDYLCRWLARAGSNAGVLFSDG